MKRTFTFTVNELVQIVSAHLHEIEALPLGQWRCPTDEPNPELSLDREALSFTFEEVPDEQEATEE